LNLINDIPSNNTFSDVLNRLKPSEFSQPFTLWVNSLGNLKSDVVSLDGKTMRRTLDKASGAPALHLVSSWSAKNLCFGQIKVNKKSNKINLTPLLLDLLDIKDVTITMDAMGCQFAIADKIAAAQANYVLALKGNQGELHEDINCYICYTTVAFSHFSLGIFKLLLKPIDVNSFFVTVNWYVILPSINMAITFGIREFSG